MGTPSYKAGFETTGLVKMVNALRTGVLLAALTAIFMAVGYLVGGQAGMFIALIFAGGMNVFAYWNSDQMVLRMQNARPVDRQRAPDLYALVEKLAGRAGIPMPKVYVIEADQPNAFATGRDPQHAAVAVSSGLLRILQEDELAGVISHELGHIRSRDTLTMTITATFAGAISMLAQFAMFGAMFGGNRQNGNALGSLLAAILAPIAAALVQMAISRTREYEADRDGAEICGDPLALASALEKIEGYARRIQNPYAERTPATAHMFIINPLSGKSMDNLFATHPATQNRIAALQSLAQQMGGRSQANDPGRKQSYQRQTTRRSSATSTGAGWRVPQTHHDERDEGPKGPWG